MEIEDFRSCSDLEDFLFDSAAKLRCDLVSPLHDAAAKGKSMIYKKIYILSRKYR